MLEYLEIENAGPATPFRLDLAPRLNFFTGDNGLGKSFLLDVAWWALVQKWPAEVNTKLQGGMPLFPDLEKDASIKFGLTGGPNRIRKFVRYPFSWEHESPDNVGVVFYAHNDGSFSIFDSLRNWQGTPVFPDPHPYVLTPIEVWQGQRNKDIQLCNGLIYDWQSWQKEKGIHFQLLCDILKVLSPSFQEIITPGDLIRISPDNAQDIPTLKLSYGQVSVVHASSGIRRILAFAYLLVWAWQEHLLARKLRNLIPAYGITFLIDEIDTHLHPKWQRTIVKSLMEVMKVLAPEIKVQILTTTHSPLVMASVEPFFDPTQDAWFDLDLNRETGQVEVVKRSEHWYRRGDSDAWLKSEAFDQKSGYAPETEQALENAGLAMQSPDFDKEKAQEIDIQLRRLLSDIDPFWIRWRYICEKRGWLN